jgi:hypothetical protein
VRFAAAAVVACAAALAALPLPAATVERLYSRGLYPRLQPMVTVISSLVPFALLDVAVVLLAGVAVWRLLAWRRAHVPRLALRLAVAAVVCASAIYLWFLLFWGLNYRRVPLEQQLAYDPSRITRQSGVEFARAAIVRTNALRSAAAPASSRPASPPSDESLVYALNEVLQQLGATKTTVVSAAKLSVLQLYFRKAAIDGMTDPFFLEVILNPDLLPSERPFTLAHEWAHLAGYADESEANFVAWLACIRASPPAQYSGWLSAYQHVASGLPPQDRRALAAGLSPAVVADLAAERARFARSSERVRVVARGAYDTYLRANRIEEGIANYNAVVRLMLGTSFDADWKPQLR